MRVCMYIYTERDQTKSPDWKIQITLNGNFILTCFYIFLLKALFSTLITQFYSKLTMVANSSQPQLILLSFMHISVDHKYY